MGDEDITPLTINDPEQPAWTLDSERTEAKDDEGTKSDDEESDNSVSPKSFLMKMVYSEGILLLLGLIAIALDPLFFYIPMVKYGCVGLDAKLKMVLPILRTIVDILHDVLWWSQRRVYSRWLAHKLPSPGRRSSITARVKHFLTSFKLSKIFTPHRGARLSKEASLIAIIASWPFPQIIVLTSGLQSNFTTLIKFGVICPFIPRICRIYPSYATITSDSDMNAWAGAGFNLLLFVLASHAIGGFWYLGAVDRKLDCINEVCQSQFVYCPGSSFVCIPGFNIETIRSDNACSVTTIPFDYGLQSDAIKSNIIGSTDFIRKLAFGFWWGLHNLSSAAQNLQFDGQTGDTLFAIFICIFGLVLYALFIGNLQMYLQSTMPYNLVKVKTKLLEKRAALEKWDPFSSLPNHLKEEVKMCKHPMWREVSEVNIESLLNNVPLELHKKLKLHFCKKMFHKVKEFRELHPKLKLELQQRAKPVVFQEGTKIQQEGKRIYKMVHIVQGKVVAYNEGNVSEKELTKGDFFGEELLLRALDSPSCFTGSINATQTIECVTKVEAFALSIDDFAEVLTNNERSLQPNNNLSAADVSHRRMRAKSFPESLIGKKSLQITHATHESSFQHSNTF